MKRRLLLVDHELGLGLIGFDIPIGIDHPGCAFENSDDFPGQCVARFLVWSVNFSNQCLQNRWTGGYFRDGDARAKLFCNGSDVWPNPARDLMALCFALALAHEVYLNI